MEKWIRWGKGMIPVALLCASLTILGCKGSDTRDKVDDTVKELTGKKDLDRYKKMKKEMGEIQTQQTKKYRQLEESGKDK
jgi:hypothetical protein